MECSIETDGKKLTHTHEYSHSKNTQFLLYHHQKNDPMNMLKVKKTPLLTII